MIIYSMHVRSSMKEKKEVRIQNILFFYDTKHILEKKNASKN
jgi:hypothetical protein